MSHLRDVSKQSQHAVTATPPLSMLRIRAVMNRTGLARSTIYAKIASGDFPAAIPLGKNARAVGWLAHEVEAWLKQQIDQSRTAA